MVSFPRAVVLRKTVALAQSGYGLSRPCCPVAEELKSLEGQSSQVPAASPCIVYPPGPPGNEAKFKARARVA